MVKKIKLTNGNDTFTGTSKPDFILGLGGNDKINGGKGNGADTIIGAAGKDKLTGGGGNDKLTGGKGADQLTGGKGGDTFAYTSLKDSTAAAGIFSKKSGDLIKDFTSIFDDANVANEDKIDMSGLAKKSKHAFLWADKTATANGVWYAVAGTESYVYADTTGDGVADLAIKFKGAETLVKADFKNLVSSTITMDKIAGDGILNIAEGTGTVNLTGKVDGDAKLGDLVTITVNGITYTGAVLANNVFNIAVSGDGLLKDADHKIETAITLTDAGKNIVTTSVATTYTLDQIAPVATISVDKVTADNSINAAEEASTVVVTGKVTGEFSAGDMVTLTVNGTDISRPVDAAGVFSIPVPGGELAADGNHIIDARVTYTDLAGNPATATTTKSYNYFPTGEPVGVSIDNVTADNVVNSIEGANLVVVTGKALLQAKDGDDITTTINGVNYQTTVQNGSFSLDVNGNDLLQDADKSFTVKIDHVDGGGNKTSNTASITYIVATSGNGSLSVNTVTADNIINATEYAAGAANIKITGATGGSFKDDDTVTLTVNKVDYTGLVSNGTYAIDVNSDDLRKDADQTIAAKAVGTDTFGNPVTVTAAKGYSVDLQAVAGVTLTSVTTDNIINLAESISNTVAITGKVTGDFNVGDNIDFTINGKLTHGKVTDLAGNFTGNVNGSDLLADTDKTIDASYTATDNAGNTKTVTGQLGYTVDTTTVGTVTLDKVTSDNILNAAEAGGTVAISGSVTGDFAPGDTVTVTYGTKTATTTVLAGGTYTTNVKGSDLQNITSIGVSVTGKDTALNPLTATDTQNYTVDTVATATITLDKIATDDIINSAESLVGTTIVTGKVGGDVAVGDTVTLSINGKPFSGTVQAGNTFSIGVTTVDLVADTDKTFTASVTAKDSALNTATAVATKTYVVDTAATGTITINSVTPDNVLNGAESAATSVTITGTVGGEAKLNDIVTLTINGNSTYKGNVTAGNVFSINVAGSDLLADANKTIDASVAMVDSAGNSGNAVSSKAYTVDTAATGTLTIGTVTADNSVTTAEAAGNIIISGTAGGEAKTGDIVSLLVNGKIFTGSVAGGAFNISVAGSELVADSDFTIDASMPITDAAGNTATLTATKTYLVPGKVTATIAVDKVTTDNIVNATEAGGTVKVTGIVGGNVKDGDVVSLTVNGKVLTGSASGGTFSINVNGSDLLADSDKIIDASVTTTSSGNSATGTDKHAYTVDTTAPVATITLDTITADNILTSTEASGIITVTGHVTGEYTPGDAIVLTVDNGTGIQTFNGIARADGTFSIDVTGSRLSSDLDHTLVASLTATDAALNSAVYQARQAYIVPGNLDMTNLNSAEGFVIVGDGNDDHSGRSVFGGGDINGDGFADMIIGSAWGRDGGVHAGEGNVIFGSASGFGVSVADANGIRRQTIDLTTLSATQGFIIQGDVAGDYAGYSVSTLKDINGDGLDELIVGAAFGGDGGANAGESYIIFGTTSGFGTNVTVGTNTRKVIDLTTLGASQGFIVQGDSNGDLTGRSVSSAGDINGDGYDDIIIGSPDDLNAGAVVDGQAAVIFGTAAGFGTLVGGRMVIDLTNLTAAQGFILQGGTQVQSGSENAGYSVSSAGDINGDGLDDLLVGARFNSESGNGAGATYVIFGKADVAGAHTFGVNTVFNSVTRKVMELRSISAQDGFVVRGTTAANKAGDYSGFSASRAGDFNGDGFDDFIIGAPRGDAGANNSGDAYVIFGHGAVGAGNPGFGVDIATTNFLVTPANPFVLRTILSSTLTQSEGFIITGSSAYDTLGISVRSAGDFNGDGYADLIIGATNADGNGTDRGAAYVIFGTSATLGALDANSRRVLNVSNLTSTQGFAIFGDYDAGSTGRSVSSAGDVNGDGFDDLIVGSPYSLDTNLVSSGASFVILGHAAGIAATPITLTGTSAAEKLIGAQGNDTLTGGGGADIFRGGAGNDIIGVTGTNFIDIDGGNGKDTLRIDGAGDVFNFSLINIAKVQSIEQIDLGATNGAQRVNLDRLDLLDLSNDISAGVTTLTIFGASPDTVQRLDSGWTLSGSQIIGTDHFNIYLNGNARLLIDTDIQVL